MKTVVTCLLVLLLGGLATAKKAPPSGAKEVAAASNAFAADLYRMLDGGNRNLFFSPYSISTALAMTRQGAKGDTAAEIDKVFHWTNGTDAAAHRALAAALVPGIVTEGWGDDAKEIPAFGLHVANALWAQKGLPVESPFSKTLNDRFGAPLRRLDFADSKAARAVINGWVAKQTKDRIKDIVPEDLPTPDTRFALANAIWFKAAWKDPFEARWTKDAVFTTTGDEVFEVPLMHRNGGYSYAEDDAVQVVEIPYRGEQASMVVILPRKKDGLPAVEKGLTGKRIGDWIAALRPRQVAVKFPRFEITLSTDLTTALPKMGMSNAFTAKADFTGMTKERPLFIGAVLHKAFVSVDEAGTEAAAATVVMMLKGGMPADPVPFTADHPFIFVIRHRATNAILFMGRFAGPVE